jgi:serine protease Do
MPARPSIGIVVATVDATEALHTGLTPGLYVENVAENTDAYAQGLQAGDRIISAADIPVHNILDLRSVIGRFRIGDTLTLTIERDGEIFDLDVILMDSDLIVW